MDNDFGRVTSDSADYNHTFYGILNAQGKFWTPLPFHDEKAALAHLCRYAVGSNSSMLDTHRIVPVRVVLTVCDSGIARTSAAPHRSRGPSMTLAVLHHPCGKREVLFPFEEREFCPACARRREDTMDALIARTKARMAEAFSGAEYPAKRRAHP